MTTATPHGGLISPGQLEPSELACAVFSKALKENHMTTVVIKQQDEIEVFVNENNSVTIQQTNSLGEVHLVYFWPEHAEAVIVAIERVAVQAEKAAQWVDNAGQDAP